MPDIIKELPEHIANLIAAGEVVQRPASVIKELCENSADAGATKITVEFTDGGMTFMRVSDDGCGMSSSDARTAFLRHATSKISLEEDLDRIMTHGFRGEALASIAAVARIDLLTRERGTIEGTSVSLEGGTVTEHISAGCPEGTTIVVRDLFFNTPARMKYVKKNVTEAAAIVSAVQEQALAHPDISYKLIKDGRQSFMTSGSGDLKSVVYDVFGREFATSLRPIRGQSGGVLIEGFISRPTASRGNRSAQHFVVNKRPVKSRLLTAAVEEGCKTRIPTGRYPACVVSIQIKPTALDVNVHPAKLEVKFASDREIFDAVYYAVLGALTTDEGKPELRFRDAVRPQVPQKSEKENLTFRTMSIEDYRKMIDSAVPPAAKTAKPQAANIAMPKEEKRSFEAKKPLAEPDKTYTQPVKMPEPEPCREPAKAEIPPKEETAPKVIETAPTPVEQPSPIVSIEAEVKKSIRVIGEAMRTYIIVEEEDGLLLIDKHAAHERIIFERLRNEQEAPVSQLLMVPEVVKLTQKEAQVLFEQLDVINAAGFEAEEFGDDCLIVRQVPSCIDAPDAQTVLQQLADELLEGRNMSPEHKREQLLYRVACRAAIKAGRQSSYAELKALAEEVVSREDIRYCPHGRPVTVSITKATLDKQFGR